VTTALPRAVRVALPIRARPFAVAAGRNNLSPQKLLTAATPTSLTFLSTTSIFLRSKMPDDNKPGAPASPRPSGQLSLPPSEGSSKYTPSPSRALLIVPEHPPAMSDAGPSVEQQLAELRAQLQARDADLAKKNAVIAGLQRALVTMDREATVDEQEMTQLRDQNARLQADVKNMRFKIESELTDQFTELHDRVQAANLRESQLNTRNVDMDTRELAIGNRQKTVDELFKKLAEENLENPDVFNAMLETFKKDLEVEYAQAETALQQRNAAAKSDEEFNISMIDKLKKLSLLDPQGVKSHIDHATSARPRSLADSKHADPASRQSAEEIQAIKSRIFSYGVDVGYLHYAMQAELLRGFRGLIKGSDGTPIQVAPEKVAFLKDYNNPRHPYQTGLRIGRTASWSVLCKAHKRPEWDTRQFKYEWRLEAFSPLDYSPQPKTFWDGVLKAVEDTREAFEKQLAEAENSGSSGAAAASTGKSGKKKDAEGGGSKN